MSKYARIFIDMYFLVFIAFGLSCVFVYIPSKVLANELSPAWLLCPGAFLFAMFLNWRCKQ